MPGIRPKLDTRTQPGPRGAEASKRGTVSSVLEGVSPPPSHGAGGCALPLRSLLTRGRAGVFIAKPSRSRALRRVVAERFQERISAGIPPKVSRVPGGPSSSRPSPFLGHFSNTAAPGPACGEDAWSPAWRALGPGGMMRSTGSGDPRIVSQNASGHGLCQGAKGHSWRWVAFPSSYNARIGST